MNNKGYGLISVLAAMIIAAIAFTASFQLTVATTKRLTDAMLRDNATEIATSYIESVLVSDSIVAESPFRVVRSGDRRSDGDFVVTPTVVADSAKTLFVVVVKYPHMGTIRVSRPIG